MAYKTIGIYEIEPVELDGEYCQVCEPEFSDVWSVYERMSDGTAKWIKDFKTEEQARDFVKSIKGDKIESN